MFPKFLLKESIVAREGYNRWLITGSALGIHLCIGSVYAWSLFNPALTRRVGVVTSASADWSLSNVVWIFTVAIVVLGLSAALLGKWLERVGPRLVGLVAAVCWGGGFIVGGLGILTGQLWLLYLGYGVIGGIGLGAGYITPVSTLVRWFPDRRGMATGIAIMGFGGGAMIAKFMIDPLIRAFYQAPEYLGAKGAVELVTEGGKRFARVGSELVEVVVVSSNDVAQMIVPGPEGVYVAGTGSVGAAQTFITLGVVYFVIMAVAAFSYRVPAQGWQPAGFVPKTGKAMVTHRDVHVDQALKTPQFYQLWIMLCFNVAAGIGVLGVAKTMMTEIFGTTLPGTVDKEFASTYVLMISVFNLIGRFSWASVSDYIGRKNTYHVFFGLGILLYLSIPFMAQQVSVSPSIVYLVGFYAVTMLIFTMYGGGFATIPAYIADVFGTRFVGAIHGRLLTAWSTAAVIGGAAITSLRQNAVNGAIERLAADTDPAAFQAKFGAAKSQLASLVDANTVTISKLMEIAPAGTVDPTPSLYNSTMYLMAALLALALVANVLMRPVDDKHHMESAEEDGSGTNRGVKAA
ncbi:MAG TPA: OFA family MFS transporter [Myxococcales bacterium LLY-WYZ-16_1]|jgi:MFS family permease|nr:OFA family MFS transporter [Myxococcales bacterium LLY-WYZ-16_1]